jgi:8-oxo-dGTP pyrophosphatase MutT (NUDIX family)
VTTADPAGRLHAAAVRELAGWAAPDHEQEALRSAYLEHLAAHPDGLTRRCVPAHLTASALVVDAPGARVLLVRHRKGGFWVQPGGHCEPADRTLAQAALREATEESGIAGLTAVGPGPVDLDRHELPSAFGACGVHLDVRYLLVAPDGAEPAVSEESDDVGWFGWDEVPAAAVADLARLVDRGRQVLAAERRKLAQPEGGSTSSSASTANPPAAATPSR